MPMPRRSAFGLVGQGDSSQYGLRISLWHVVSPLPARLTPICSHKLPPLEPPLSLGRSESSGGSRGFVLQCAAPWRVRNQAERIQSE